MGYVQNPGTNPVLLYLFIICFSLISPSVLSDPRNTQSGLYCGSSKPSPNKSSSLIPTFVKEMEALSQVLSNTHFATSYFNSSQIPMYALAQCHHDLSQTDCLLCYAASRTKLPRCLPSLSAAIFLDGCFLRYDNYSFYQESVSSSLEFLNCSSESVPGDEDEMSGFEMSVRYAIGNVTSRALGNSRFGVFGESGVYALAQCWESVEKEGCRECLEKAGAAAKGCGAKKEARAMNAGCYLRYSTEKFYGEDINGGHGEFYLSL